MGHTPARGICVSGSRLLILASSWPIRLRVADTNFVHDGALIAAVRERHGYPTSFNLRSHAHLFPHSYARSPAP